MKLKRREAELTTIQEAAAMVRMHENTFYKYVRNRHLIPPPKTQKGRRRYYDQSQLAEVVVAVNDLRRMGVVQ